MNVLTIKYGETVDVPPNFGVFDVSRERVTLLVPMAATERMILKAGVEFDMPQIPRNSKAVGSFRAWDGCSDDGLHLVWLEPIAPEQAREACCDALGRRSAHDLVNCEKPLNHEGPHSYKGFIWRTT